MYKKCQSKIPPHFFHTYQETISWFKPKFIDDWYSKSFKNTWPVHFLHFWPCSKLPQFCKKIIITLYLSYFASYIIVYSYLIKDDYPYMKNSQKKILCLYFSFFRNLAGPFEKLKSGGAILLTVGLWWGNLWTALI